MNKARFSKQAHQLSGDPSEDIPMALRDVPESTAQPPVQNLVLVMGGLAGFILVGLIAGLWFFVISPRADVDSSSPQNLDTQPGDSVNSQNNQNNNNVDALLGHLIYPEVPQSELLPITADGRIRLRIAAAEWYLAMAQAARREGVILVPISGFRSVEEQEQLFFAIGARRNQTPAQRAALSAPPGYSEHHTGYAVDIGDGAVPATNLQTNFENTRAFRWLEANAARFGFELSFGENNPQGVSYEPWHWRFVGDRHSLELFYKARNLNSTR